MADQLLEQIRTRLEKLVDDEQALGALTFFVSSVVASRGHGGAGEPGFGPESAVKRAADATLQEVERRHFEQRSIASESKRPEARNALQMWRAYDGSGFCDLGRLFFACLVEQHLLYYLRANSVDADPADAKRHAWELSLITRSFSARWFNSLRGAKPDRGAIRWYLGHCLGKLDMEFERELSTHVEPLPSPLRRKKVEPPSLGLGI